MMSKAKFMKKMAAVVIAGAMMTGNGCAGHSSNQSNRQRC